jgi:hypothetical protein
MRNKKFDIGDVVIPSWLNQVNPHSTLTVKDMAQLFDVSKNFVHTLMTEGRLPRPDIDTNYQFGKPLNPMMGLHPRNSRKLLWRVGTVIKIIKDGKKK